MRQHALQSFPVVTQPPEARFGLALRFMLPFCRMPVPCVQVKPVWGDVHVVIAGLTNTYSSYVTTIEEYSIQRYEGASTIFGPHTLDAYIQVQASMSCYAAACVGACVEERGLGVETQTCVAEQRAVERVPHRI